jgi:hypothetical protein
MMASRRHFLSLLGPHWLGLRALATGLPISLLTASDRALAQMGCPVIDAPQYLLFCTSKDGDPLNNNVPGTYSDDKVWHPSDPRMAATDFTVGTTATRAAKPWSTLPKTVLDRTVFFHHTTRTNNHANHNKVMRLMGDMKAQEMLPSFIAKQLAPCLKTIQTEPICLGAADPGERLAIEGRAQPWISPTTVKDLLVVEKGPLEQLQRLRDADLNRLNAVLKQNGTRAQRSFVDSWANSQAQARQLSTTLLEGLSGISNNGPESQAIAATILFKMNVGPVMSMHISFGGDNHSDPNLAYESNETVSGVANVAAVMKQLTNFQMQDRVTFVMLNVFGRGLSPADRLGRTHSADHHCSVLVGAPFRGGIVGGIQRAGDDFEATPIDPATGKADPVGQISRDQSLGSLAKTVAQAVGVKTDALESNIANGKVVQRALL